MLFSGVVLSHGRAAVADVAACRSFAEVAKNPVDDEIEGSRFTVMPKDPVSLWQFTGFIDGKEVPLKSFKSKASLVVNVASE